MEERDIYIKALTWKRCCGRRESLVVVRQFVTKQRECCDSPLGQLRGA